MLTDPFCEMCIVIDHVGLFIKGGWGIKSFLWKGLTSEFDPIQNYNKAKIGKNYQFSYWNEKTSHLNFGNQTSNGLESPINTDRHIEQQ